jgi:hypothetical protein
MQYAVREYLEILIEILRNIACYSFTASQLANGVRIQAKTLNKKTVQHNVDDDILTKQYFPKAGR